MSDQTIRTFYVKKTASGLPVKSCIRRFIPEFFNEGNDHNPIVAKECVDCEGRGNYCKTCEGEGFFDEKEHFFTAETIEAAAEPSKSGAVKCPACGKQFPITSNQYWTGKRHRCGQRLRLEGEFAELCWSNGNRKKNVESPAVAQMVKRIPCLECSKGILEATVKNTGGYCVPCHRKLPAKGRGINPFDLPSKFSPIQFKAKNQSGLRHFAQLMTSRCPELVGMVETSIASPDEFCKRYQNFLRTDRNQLPWAVIVESLKSKSEISGLDWKCSIEDICFVVGRMSGFPVEAKELLGKIAKESPNRIEAFQKLDSLLEERDLSLVNLEGGNDSYDLMILDKSEIASCEKALSSTEYSKLVRFR